MNRSSLGLPLLIAVTVLSLSVFAQNNISLNRTINTDETIEKIKNDIYARNLDSTLIDIQKLLDISESEDLVDINAMAMNFLGEYFQITGNLDTSVYFLKEALVFYDNVKDTVVQGRINARIAYNYKIKGVEDPTIHYYHKSLEYLSINNDTMWYGFVNDNLGMIYYRKGNYYRALEHIQQAITAFKLLDYKLNVGNEYNTMGVIYRKTNDKAKEEQAYLNAIEVLEEIDESNFLGYAYNNLSEMYLDKGKTDSAFKLLEKARLVFQNTGNQLGLCSYYSVLAYHHSHSSPPEYDKVIDYCNKSMTIAEEHGDFQQYSDATSYLGTAYRKTNQLRKAKDVLEKGLSVATKYGYKAEIVKITEELAKVYKLQNRTDLALKALETHLAYKDSTSGEERIKEFTSLDLKFGFRQQQISDSLAQIQKDQELIFLHEKEMQSQKQTQIVLFFIAVLVIIVAFFSFLNARRNKRQAVVLNEKNNVINQALTEKELLLKEVHHRVKNNFQLVSSLLELQSKEIKDTKALESISEGKNRVRAMALIHQKLYQNENIAAFDFKTYCVQLINEIKGIYAFDEAVQTDIQIDDIHLDIDTAIPLGLIVNELITNAFKYAFKEGRKNKLFFSITKEKTGNYLLVLKDNGSGLPPDLNISKTKSLGLRLVQRLTRQLHGTFNYTMSSGSVISITFKDTIQRKETA